MLRVGLGGWRTKWQLNFWKGGALGTPVSPHNPPRGKAAGSSRSHSSPVVPVLLVPPGFLEWLSASRQPLGTACKQRLLPTPSGPLQSGGWDLAGQAHLEAQRPAGRRPSDAIHPLRIAQERRERLAHPAGPARFSHLWWGSSQRVWPEEAAGLAPDTRPQQKRQPGFKIAQPLARLAKPPPPPPPWAPGFEIKGATRHPALWEGG